MFSVIARAARVWSVRSLSGSRWRWERGWPESRFVEVDPLAAGGGRVDTGAGVVATGEQLGSGG